MVSVSSLDFWSIMVICCLFSWPDKLVCSQRMAAGVGDWLGYWNELGEGRLEEIVLAICWEWGEREWEVTVGFLL